MSTDFKPYLSVVTASRNDDHGGDPLARTQIFVDNLLSQAEHWKLPLELVLVDWNPVPDRPPLGDVLDWSRLSEWTRVRLVTVPAEIHDRLQGGENLAFFQMLAKNAGLCRATGEFLLATNIDILFSEELISWIAGRNLRPGLSYRVDRFDIANGVPAQGTWDEQLDYAWKHLIRVHRRGESVSLDPAGTPYRPEFVGGPRVEWDSVDAEQGTAVMPGRCRFHHLHTNGCGDFHLMSRENWYQLGGYAEFELFSLHIDSLFSYCAHYGGVRECFLQHPKAIFHIEHEVGSGWSPEGEEKLFARLAKRRIVSLPWQLVEEYGRSMQSEGEAVYFNDEGWGFAGQPEIREEVRGGGS